MWIKIVLISGHVSAFVFLVLFWWVWLVLTAVAMENLEIYFEAESQNLPQTLINPRGVKILMVAMT